MTLSLLKYEFKRNINLIYIISCASIFTLIGMTWFNEYEKNIWLVALCIGVPLLLFFPLYTYDRDFKSKEGMMWVMIPTKKRYVLLNKLLLSSLLTYVFIVINTALYIGVPEQKIENFTIYYCIYPLSVILLFFIVEFFVISFIHIFLQSTQQILSVLGHVLLSLFLMSLGIWCYLRFRETSHSIILIMLNLESLILFVVTSWLLEKRMSL